MKKFSKISLIGALGGSMFIADNVFDIGNNRVSALTQETDDRLRAQRIAAALTPSINLLLLNEDEFAIDDSYTAQQNTLFTIDAAGGVLANDNALASPTLTLLEDVNNGSLTLNPDGSFEYLPNIDFTGTDSFTYSLTTSIGQVDDATVNIRVNGTPEAFDDDYSLATNALFQDNVITNVVDGSDTILDGAQVVEVINEPTSLGGTVSIQPNGDFQYTPPANLNAQQDSFVYSLQDNDGEIDTATITWQIGVGIGDLGLPFSVAENQVLNSQFTITAPNGLQTLEINGTPFTLAQLIASNSAAPLTVSGEQFGEFIITRFDEISGVLNFTFDPTGINQDHSATTNDALVENISIRVTDVGIATPFEAQLLINVQDTSPVANNETRSISEGTSAIAGNAVRAAGAATGDVLDIIVDPATVTDLDFGTTDGTVGTNLAGGFGSMIINSAGVYTYTLNNNSTTVQGLKAGESVADVFTYTLTDDEAPQADSDTATITVTINGVEDRLPTVTVADLNGGAAGQQSVTESAGGSVNGSVTINATAGTQSLTVSGQEVANASATAVTITGADGDLVATSFDAFTGLLSYTYTEDGANNDHSAGAVTDQFMLFATDNEGDTAANALSITIDDTQPTAMADSNTVAEDAASPAVTGDLLANDTAGADTPLTINGIAAGASGQTLGQYGTLLVTSGGGYTYTLMNNNAAVQALQLNQQLIDTFSYTVADTDGDSSNSLLNVTITGLDELPALSIPDSNGGVSVGDESVTENSTINSFFSANVESGLATAGTALQVTNEQGDALGLTLVQLQSLSSNTQSLVGVDGTITLNGFNISNDDVTISYTFDPTGTNRDHTAGDDSVVDMFSIVVTDDLSQATDVGVLDILITDTAPTAALDTASITEDAEPNVVSGDVTTNDTSGADTAVSVVGVEFDSTQTVGRPFSSDYGTLDLNSDGSYTYTLDNGNSNVQNLNPGESLAESFSYTIVDTDGDTSTTSLTVTINGTDEPPSIIVPDVNGTAVVGDLSVPENLTSDGSFIVTTTDGLAVVGPALQVRDEQSDTLNLTRAQLQNLATANQTLVSRYGSLTLNDYANLGDDHTIGFSFDPTGSNQNHSGGDIIDMFSITATDLSGRTSSAEVLDILITDTSPVANDDARSISEGTSAIAGNAVGVSGAASGDVQDTSSDPITVTDVDFGATDGIPGSNLAGAFGTFIINSAGVYTYTLDNRSPDIQGLKNGQSLTDVFTYTITDNETPLADTDTANVTVTIFGVEDALPTITLADANDSAAGQQSVVEGSGTTVNGIATITASAGIKSLTIADQNVAIKPFIAASITGSNGELVITNFNPNTSMLSYSYTENGTPNDHSTGTITDQFAIVATDNEDDTSSNTLSISIDDTNAVAIADTGSVTEDAAPNLITGNVFDNDTGADSKTVTQLSFSGGLQTIGSLITTTYGDFSLSTAGTYTYTLNNGDADTNALNNGDSVTETFTYTLTDLDGDTSSSTLSITVNGADDV